MLLGLRPSPRSLLIAVVAAAVFLYSWLYRFNDPGGSFAGLTDDHFFYVVRGWQILFGDLPVRDFVDHGAPLYYYLAYAVQVILGRGTLSELVFSTTLLSLAAAGTFWLATMASGWIPAGIVATVFHVWLAPRFYNYPKVLVYAVAIPLIWSFIDRPRASTRFWIALLTVVAFLLRHDHGVFVAVAMAVALLLMSELTWSARLRHAVIYGALVLSLAMPYLLFIQWNGGLGGYFRQASAWAERDRDRAPVAWPGLVDNPDGVSDAARNGGAVTRAIATVRDNRVAWIYYIEIALPLLALALLAMSRDGFRPTWPRARAKLVIVAALAIVLDAGFLRSPLEARLADPSVPIVIILAWLVVAVAMLCGRAKVGPAHHLRQGSGGPPELYAKAEAGPHAPLWLVRLIAVPSTVVIVMVLYLSVSADFYRRLDKAAMTDRFGKPFERVGHIARQMREEWSLATWMARDTRPDLVTLSLYVNACTNPGDRVLVQAYMPQVLGLARRAFAGGHADLRPGFFKTEEAQRLVVERLQRQSVPMILLETGDSLGGFRDSFPIVTAHIDRHYQIAATRVFDGRFGVTLFVRRDAKPEGTWEPLGWPCYARGQIVSSTPRPTPPPHLARVRGGDPGHRPWGPRV
jgi:hypothetical protein